MIKIVRGEDGSHETWQVGKNASFLRPTPIPSRKARKLPIVVEVRQMPAAFSVETLEGTMEGKEGDFLICGVKGEMYPCDRDIFFASYEFVDDGEE